MPTTTLPPAVPRLQTPRLVLRALDPGDANDIFAYAADPEVARYTLWRAHTSIEESRQFIAWLTRVSMACWALVHSDSGHVIGTSFLHSYHLKNFRFVLLEKCGHTPWLERWAREGFYRIIKAELL